MSQQFLSFFGPPGGATRRQVSLSPEPWPPLARVSGFELGLAPGPRPRLRYSIDTDAWPLRLWPPARGLGAGGWSAGPVGPRPRVRPRPRAGRRGHPPPGPGPHAAARTPCRCTRDTAIVYTVYTAVHACAAAVAVRWLRPEAVPRRTGTAECRSTVESVLRPVPFRSRGGVRSRCITAAHLPCTASQEHPRSRTSSRDRPHLAPRAPAAARTATATRPAPTRMPTRHRAAPLDGDGLDRLRKFGHGRSPIFGVPSGGAMPTPVDARRRIRKRSATRHSLVPTRIRDLRDSLAFAPPRIPAQCRARGSVVCVHEA